MAITINGSGTITGISAGGLPDNCITAADLATTLDLSSSTITLPSGTGGKILQVVQTVNSGVESTITQDTYEDLPGMSLSITPASTSSKILITVSIGRIGCNSSDQRQTNFRLMRGTTAIALGDQLGSNRMRGTMSSGTIFENNIAYSIGGIGFTFLDSPSTTSATTYKVQWGGQNGDTHYLNRSAATTDSVDAPYCTTTSSITAMEVAG